MAKRFIYTCDYCEDERDEAEIHEMVMWLHLDCRFILPLVKIDEPQKSKTDENGEPQSNLRGDFCSLECLYDFLKKPIKKPAIQSSQAVMNLEGHGEINTLEKNNQ